VRASEYEEQRELDEILGITRCARCGHRLDGHTECPFCAVVEAVPKRPGLPVWIFITACILTSPLGLVGILRTDRLGRLGRSLATSASAIWTALVIHYFFG
jgi:hypothetical protein